MKISILLGREPFDKIIESTLSDFLSDYYNKSFYVEWHRGTKNKWRQFKVNGQLWLCNPLINAIFVPDVRTEVFDIIKPEYSRHPIKIWRSPFQRIYIELATQTYLRKLFASYSLRISPSLENANQLLLMGGNHKIRLINLKNNTVFVILKSGEDPKYIERELYIKKQFNTLPTPHLKQVGDGCFWYSEDLIKGITPDRLKDKIAFSSAITQAIESLHSLLKETAREEDAKDYAYAVADEIHNRLLVNKLLNEEEKRKLLAGISNIIQLIKKYLRLNSNIVVTAHTHGDFQEGNILYDDKCIWLMDWEYSSRRHIGYDAFVLLLKSRLSGGLATRMYNLINDTNSQTVNTLNNWPSLKWKDSGYRRILLLLFLLDELAFLLEENQNRYLEKPSKSLTQFQKEMPILLNLLS